MLDGLLAPETSPPGETRISQDVSPTSTRYFQLEQILSSLYGTSITRISRPLPRLPVWTPVFVQHAHRSQLTYPACDHWLRTPGEIFVSIGGNDIGFSGLAAWAIFPQSISIVTGSVIRAYVQQGWSGLAMVCPHVPYKYSESVRGYTQDPRCRRTGPTIGYDADDSIKIELPTLLQLAALGIRNSGLSQHAKVIQTEYPNPMHNQDGQFFGPDGNAISDNHAPSKEMWRALHAYMPERLLGNRTVQVTRGES